MFESWHETLNHMESLLAKGLEHGLTPEEDAELSALLDDFPDENAPLDCSSCKANLDELRQKQEQLSRKLDRLARRDEDPPYEEEDADAYDDDENRMGLLLHGFGTGMVVFPVCLGVGWAAVKGSLYLIRLFHLSPAIYASIALCVLPGIWITRHSQKLGRGLDRWFTGILDEYDEEDES